jgi:hypothetical protein
MCFPKYLPFLFCNAMIIKGIHIAKTFAPFIIKLEYICIVKFLTNETAKEDRSTFKPLSQTPV